jgi:hypothetical protein
MENLRNYVTRLILAYREIYGEDAVVEEDGTVRTGEEAP